MGAIALGAIYAVVSPPQPIIKPIASESPTRTLAYQQQIARPNGGAPAAEQDAKQQHAMVPAEPAQAKLETPAAQSAPKPQAAAPARPDAAQQGNAPPDMAALPPDDAAAADDPDALPWQRRGEGPYDPAYPEEGAIAPGQTGAWRGEEGYPQDGAEAMPEDADPNAWPARPEAEPQEWVQVLVSGAGMHGTASEESPMLFAFPYGRTLRVISRYGNWVQVTDPQSTTTGWMKAQYLAPAAAPGSPQEAESWYDEEQPRRRRGWWRRNGGGLADMINRALGGY
jgi:hypothetical protein